jgi:hypothetical protein
MICAELVTVSGVQVVSPAASQPADVSTCSAVVLVGSDTQQLQAFAFPSAPEAAAAWGLGFTVVFGTFLASWGAGAIVNMFNGRKG